MSVDNKFLVRDKITLKVTGLGSSGEGVESNGHSGSIT